MRSFEKIKKHAIRSYDPRHAEQEMQRQGLYDSDRQPRIESRNRDDQSIITDISAGETEATVVEAEPEQNADEHDVRSPDNIDWFGIRNLVDEFKIHIPTLRKVPYCIRDPGNRQLFHACQEPHCVLASA